MVEKGQIAIAIYVEAGILSFSQPERLAVTPTAAATDRIVLTGLAFGRNWPRRLDKCLGQFAGEQICKETVLDRTETPFVEDIEVTGVDAAISLNDTIAGATATHAAGFRGLALEHVDPVVEMADADVPPGHEVLVPLVEEIYQEFAIAFSRQRKGAGTWLLAKIIDAGDELQVAKAVVDERMVNMLGPPSQLAGDDHQVVELDLVFL